MPSHDIAGITSIWCFAMASFPYTEPYEHIKDIDRFFEYDDKLKCMTFIGQSLVVYIPARYEVFDLLTMADTVTTLAVVDLVIDQKYRAGLLLLATIEMEPDDVEKIMVDDLQYVKLTLSTGAKFICNTERIADATIVYAVWTEFVGSGKLPYFIDYSSLSKLFDQAKSMCDLNIPVDHVMYEVIFSYLCREQDNLSVTYRHTDMFKPFKMIGLRNVGYATSSTLSKIMGSYFSQGLNSSLIQTSTERSPMEDLLRS